MLPPRAYDPGTVLAIAAHGEAEHDWAVMAKDQARASGLA